MSNKNLRNPPACYEDGCKCGTRCAQDGQQMPPNLPGDKSNWPSSLTKQQCNWLINNGYEGCSDLTSETWWFSHDPKIGSCYDPKQITVPDGQQCSKPNAHVEGYSSVQFPLDYYQEFKDLGTSGYMTPDLGGLPLNKNGMNYSFVS